MLDKIDITQITGMKAEPGTNPRNSDRITPEAKNNQEDVSLHTEYSGLIKEGLNTTETNPQAVEQAQKLMAEGLLDTPENIAEAAINMLNYGM